MLHLRNISIIGAGSWGTALAVILQKNGHEVMLWARSQEAITRMQEEKENRKYLPNIPLSEKILITNDRKEVAEFGEIVILAVPSRAVRQTASDFSPFLKDTQVIVNVAKGMEAETKKRLSEVIQEEIPQCAICVLSGPSHAEEVAREIPTACLIASEDEEVAKMVQQECMSPRFRLYTNTDMIGVEVGASLKNVIALVAGICDGLGFGDNTKAAIMTRGIAEMQRLGVAMGGKRETFAGLSGVGDLIVTCTSMHSRNRRAGILLGQGKSLEEAMDEIQMVVEGVHMVSAVMEIANFYEIEMPITQAVWEVLFQGKDVEKAILDLTSRDSKAE